MTDVEARLVRIERSLRRWRRLALGCLLGVLCVPFLGQAKPTPKALVIEHLTIQDRQGNPRLVLDSGGNVSMRNRQGQEVGRIDGDGISFHRPDPTGKGVGKVAALTSPTSSQGPGLYITDGLDDTLYALIDGKGASLTCHRWTGPTDPKTRLRPGEDTRISKDGLEIRENGRVVHEVLRPR